MADDTGRQRIERECGPYDALGAVLAIAFFSAVNGIHVAGLMCGEAHFRLNARIGQVMAGYTSESAPVPAHLEPTWRMLEHLGRVGGTTLVLSLTILAALLAAGSVVRLIHPSLGVLARIGLVTPQRLGVAVLVAALVLVAAFWHLPPWAYETPLPILRAAAAGAMLWVLWHSRGWLHTEDDAPSRLQLCGAFVCGAIVGAAANIAFRHVPRPDETLTMARWLGAGFYSDVAWRQILLHVAATRTLAGLAVGLLVGLLAPVRVAFRRRAMWMAPALILGLALLGAGELWRQHCWIAGYDYERALPEVTPVAQGPGVETPTDVLLLLDSPTRPVIISRASSRSASGLRTSRAEAEATDAFLERRGARTALALDAFMELHDYATANWDLAGALRVQSRQLASPSGDPIFGVLRLETLSNCGFSQAGKDALDELLDPERFRWPTDLGLGHLARVCWRWGRLEAVAPRLRDDAPDVLRALLASPPPLHDGRVRGELRLRGRPLDGVKVGVIGEDLRWAVTGPRTGPWPQRLVAAHGVTDAAGRFEIDGLFEGRYALLVRAPMRRVEPLGMMQAHGGEGIIVIARDRPRTIEVKIDLRPYEAQPPAVEVRWPTITGDRGIRHG